MAEKGFGVKEINLIGASGTPTIESPNNLNLNAVNVAISTNVSIGGTLTVSGNVSVGGTLTYEDVTNIDSVGIITARSVIQAGAGLTVVGVSTFNSDVHLGLYGAGNPKVDFDESSNLLWFKKQTAGGSSTKIWLGGGTSYDNLQLQQTYTGGGQSEITATHSNIFIACNTTGKNITIQSSNDLTLENGVYPFIKGEKNSGSDQSVTLYYGQTGSTPYANPKLETTSTGINVTGAITVNGSATSAWTISNNGASNYVISGPGGLSSANNPDLYLERGQTYQFIMNAAGHGFGIQTSSGTWNNSNAYTTGITNAGAATGTITFQVPYSAPERLYYACTSQHSGMVGNIYIQGGSTDLKMADQWRITAVHAVPTQNSIISNNWERVDGTAQGTYIPNGGMTQSSGVFSFPYTGIYLVRFQGYFEENTSTNQAQVEMRASNDGGNSYSSIAFSPCSISNLGTYTYGNIQMETLIDVTNVSNVKIYWQTYSATATALDGSSTQNRTYATFLRIGDT